jgi:2-polyprenyl-3-methyl-5-hydroxy-6-metoxy-1,4-benzoquinol methylase
MGGAAASGDEKGHVARQIEAANPWYVGKHFAWADQSASARIYRRRFEYFVWCIDRARARLGRRLRMLDAGCGDGFWLHRLSSLGDLDLTGVDYNPLRVERARAAAPAATVVCSSLDTFAPTEQFDVLLLSQVIEHVHDDVALLRHVARLLSPGGVLILGTPNEGSLLQRIERRRTGSDAATDHVHFYTEREVLRKVEAAGFQRLSVMREVFFFFTYPWYYFLTSRAWGFALLEHLTRLFPSQASDFYFECVRVPADEPGRRTTP